MKPLGLRVREKIANWLLEDVRLERVRFGQHSVTITDRITMTSIVPTGAGQIGMDTTTGRVLAFVGGASKSLMHTTDTAIPLIFSLTGVGAAGLTRYMSLSGFLYTTEIKLAMSRAGVLRNLRLRAMTGPGLGATDVVTVRINGGDTTLTSSLTGTGEQTSSDLTHAPAFTAGQDVSVKVVFDALSISSDIIASFELAAV